MTVEYWPTPPKYYSEHMGMQFAYTECWAACYPEAVRIVQLDAPPVARLMEMKLPIVGTVTLGTLAHWLARSLSEETSDFQLVGGAMVARAFVRKATRPMLLRERNPRTVVRVGVCGQFIRLDSLGSLGGSALVALAQHQDAGDDPLEPDDAYRSVTRPALDRGLE